MTPSSRPTSDHKLHFPGLGELRDAVANAARKLPSGASLRRDSVAGLTVTVASVPDGMAGGAGDPSVG